MPTRASVAIGTDGGWGWVVRGRGRGTAKGIRSKEIRRRRRRDGQRGGWLGGGGEEGVV